MPNIADRARGSFLGLAYGDILGAPVEQFTPKEIAQVFGEYRRIPKSLPIDRILAVKGESQRAYLRYPGNYTDDTQQAIALLYAYNKKPWDNQNWVEILVNGHKANAWRGTGSRFREAVQKLSDGVSWRESGSTSAGIGAAMRTGPLGAAITNADELLYIVSQTSLTTHRDVRAVAAAFAVAYSVYGILKTQDPEKVLRALPIAVARAENFISLLGELKYVSANVDTSLHEYSSVLRDVLDVGPYRSPQDFFTYFYNKDTTPNNPFALCGGVTGVLLPLLFPGHNPEELLIDIVNQGGDTDTVAAMAGSILGAMHGTEWIRLDDMRDICRLERYATSLCGDGFRKVFIDFDENSFIYNEVRYTESDTRLRERLTESSPTPLTLDGLLGL